MKFARCFLIGFLLHSTLCRPSNCKNYAHKKTALSGEQLRQLRNEYLKNQILEKLQLTKPPKTNLPKPPLKTLLAIAEMAQNETTIENDYQQHIESVVIYPKEGNLSCLGGRNFSCSRYEFADPESLTPENFVSAEVWLYTNHSKTVRAYQVSSHGARNSTSIFELVSFMENNTKPWSKYNIPGSNFRSSFRSENIVIEITDFVEVDNLVGDSEDEKPFVMIRSKTPEKVTRRKRGTTCAESSTSCCKEQFFLNFSEIKWDNWVIYPESYEANFCRGSCFNDLSNTRFYHSAVLLSYIRDKNDLAEEIGLKMCCTPSVMAPIDIIYRNEENLIYHKVLENMKVEACDCA